MVTSEIVRKALDALDIYRPDWEIDDITTFISRKRIKITNVWGDWCEFTYDGELVGAPKEMG